MSSNSTLRGKKILQGEFLKCLPPDGTPGAACSLNVIKETIQSCCLGRKHSSVAVNKSINELEDSDSCLLFESEKEQVDFLKKIYEPVERSRVHGFDYDEKSLKMLLLDETSQDSFKLIGVVGVLGVGKTALCRLIFNDEEVKQRFVPRLWIPMSEEPWQPKSKEPQSMEKVVERMLEHLGVKEETIKSISEKHKLPGLLYALYLHLKGKRFLIVLDDVRDNKDNMANMANMDQEQKQSYYEDLVSCLKNGHGFPKGHGGAVIVTSRNEEAIKKMVGEQYLHRLLPLTDPESCWAIYKDIDASKKDDMKDKAQGSRADVPKEVKKEVKKDEARGSGDASKEEKQESRTLETQGSRTDVPKEVKEELKKRCGGFPLVARMMKEIKLMREKKSNDAAGSHQASTTSKNGSDEATITKNNSSNEASTTKEG